MMFFIVTLGRSGRAPSVPSCVCQAKPSKASNCRNRHDLSTCHTYLAGHLISFLQLTVAAALTNSKVQTDDRPCVVA